VSLSGLLVASVLAGQTPAPPPPPAETPRAEAAPVSLRAQYGWGYVGRDGQGKGTLSVLIEPASGRTILELQGLGERLMLLEGSDAEGFRLQIPRQQVDQRAPSLAAVPLPFFPVLRSPAGLYRLLTEGAGPGVTVTRKDALGPVKLRYDGKDDRGREVTVWLQRTRWEPSRP